uniref:Protein NO VEIN C-terminal domain-containing protein n=1 Tax=Tenacibaculum sp. Pbs-1 TaxID=3238748 RepID=A0AB33L1X2_9FLAO
MLKELRHYDNFGTPNYFFELFNTLKNNQGVSFFRNDVEKIFYNRIIDGRSVFDGCIELALNIDIIQISNDIITLNSGIINSLNSVNQMIDKFNEFLFIALKNDDEFHSVFCSKHLSHDIIYKSLQIDNAAFGFKYSNFKQLLIDFNAIKTHPTPEIQFFIINSRYKKLFDKTVLPEIRKRKIGIEEFKKSMELQQIYGEEAEKFVLEYETNRLNNNKIINWVAEYVANEGYDIASYNNEDDQVQNRFIEVKSYEGDTPYFFWSRNEYLVAKRKREEYWVYLVNRKEMNNIDYKPIMKQNPYETILTNNNWDKRIEKYKIQLLNT